MKMPHINTVHNSLLKNFREGTLLLCHKFACFATSAFRARYAWVSVKMMQQFSVLREEIAWVPCQNGYRLHEIVCSGSNFHQQSWPIVCEIVVFFSLRQIFSNITYQRNDRHIRCWSGHSYRPSSLDEDIWQWHRAVSIEHNRRCVADIHEIGSSCAAAGFGVVQIHSLLWRPYQWGVVTGNSDRWHFCNQFQGWHCALVGFTIEYCAQHNRPSRPFYSEYWSVRRYCCRGLWFGFDSILRCANATTGLLQRISRATRLQLYLDEFEILNEH